MPNYKPSYDDKHNILWIRDTEERIHGSFDIDHYIFDHTKDDKIVGIELLDATLRLKKLVPEKTVDEIKNILCNIKECDLEFTLDADTLTVNMVLRSKTDEITLVISLRHKGIVDPPLIHS